MTTFPHASQRLIAERAGDFTTAKVRASLSGLASGELQRFFSREVLLVSAHYSSIPAYPTTHSGRISEWPAVGGPGQGDVTWPLGMTSIIEHSRTAACGLSRPSRQQSAFSPPDDIDSRKSREAGRG